jgi:type I restriction-modification system DNA methylase subunit
MDDQMALSLEDVLAAERLWLQEHEDVWSSYGNAVVRVLSRGPGGWEHLSSRALEQVISATTMALVRRNRAPRSIFDPLCGSGTLLMAAASDLADSAVQICGQDISEEALATTERVLAIGGRASSLRADDLIVTDSFPNDTFDLVVTDPPLGLKADPALWNGSTTGSIPSRLPPGTPEVRDLEWLFLAMALQKVTPREKGFDLIKKTLLHQRIGAVIP